MLTRSSEENFTPMRYTENISIFKLARVLGIRVDYCDIPHERAE